MNLRATLRFRIYFYTSCVHYCCMEMVPLPDVEETLVAFKKKKQKQKKKEEDQKEEPENK